MAKPVLAPGQKPANNSDPQPLASVQVGEAHELLQRLRQKLGVHPELDAAIEKLEAALNVLNLNTGGLL
jgi:hypothetical protein